jgi:hypothetical protein
MGRRSFPRTFGANQLMETFLLSLLLVIAGMCFWNVATLLDEIIDELFDD